MHCHWERQSVNLLLFKKKRKKEKLWAVRKKIPLSANSRAQGEETPFQYCNNVYLGLGLPDIQIMDTSQGSIISKKNKGCLVSVLDTSIHILAWGEN